MLKKHSLVHRYCLFRNGFSSSGNGIRRITTVTTPKEHYRTTKYLSNEHSTNDPATEGRENPKRGGQLSFITAPFEDDSFAKFQTANIKKVSAIYAKHLRSCGDLKALKEGKHIHAHIKKCGHYGDMYLSNLLIQMYGKCGDLQSAKSVFLDMEDRNVFSWSLMMGACIQADRNKEALQLFDQMILEGIIPDKVTCIGAISACANLRIFLIGKTVHASMVLHSVESDVFVDTALINMYGKCGDVEQSRELFDAMAKKNIVSWNAMMAACTLNDCGYEALVLYQQMIVEGIFPSNVTLICSVDACACIGSLSEGMHNHTCALSNDFASDTVLGNALINMYGKCGDVRDAQRAFDSMPKYNLSSWNTIVAVYGQHGRGKTALRIFEKMQINGVIADEITYFSVLSACSHSALVEEGCHYFSTMRNNKCISVSVEHYNCMIDLLARTGLLDVVEQLMKVMPISPDVKSWVTLLGACRMHLDEERAKRIAERLCVIDPENPSPYILLANMYTAMGKADAAALIKRRMKEKGFDIQFD